MRTRTTRTAPPSPAAAPRRSPQEATAPTPAHTRSGTSNAGPIRPASGGAGLPRGLLHRLERSSGYDLSAVRVHQDGAARRVGARAFARGAHLHFAEGEYDPQSTAGRALIGHEVAHVVQQAEGRVAGPRPGRLAVDATPHLEAEADRRGAEAAAGRPARPGAHGGEPPVRRPLRVRATAIQRKVEVPAGTALPDYEPEVKRSGNVYTHPVPDRTGDLDVELLYSLFSAARTFKLAGHDTASVQRNLRRHLVARAGILAFARKKKYAFEGGRADFRMNPKYWWWDAGTGSFGFKEGVDRQEARDDVNENPGAYAIGCAAATKITMKGGARSDLVDGSSSDDQDWVPGDGGYIKNTGWDGTSEGLEGENVIYMGTKTFWGHFGTELSIKPYAEWFALVHSWNEAARLESDRQYPTAGLL